MAVVAVGIVLSVGVEGIGEGTTVGAGAQEAKITTTSKLASSFVFM
jgi:hypothetical protein